MTKPRIRMPETIRVGDIIEVRTLVSHVMETGLRRDAEGRLVPRNLIHTFTASFEGKPVFRADLSSAISSNPFLIFTLKVPGPGELELVWLDDAGTRLVERVPVLVAP